MKKTKKWVFWTGLVGTFLVASLFLVSADFCYSNTWCHKLSYFVRHNDGDSGVLFLVFLFPPLFLLSLLTYRMRDQVFRAWWNFARWWVPVIVVVTLLLNNKGSGGGYLGMDTMFDGLVYSILYGVLIVTSIVKIVHAYDKK